MTYNQLIETIRSLLQSHAMIKTVKNVTPGEWLYKGGNDVVFPVCCFTVNTGSFNKGRQQIYSVQFFFLDKAGKEAEFEQEVISDQVGIGYDIVELMRNEKNPYSIPDEVSFNTILDAQEDYLAGVELTTQLQTQSAFDGCDVPIN